MVAGLDVATSCLFQRLAGPLRRVGLEPVVSHTLGLGCTGAAQAEGQLGVPTPQAGFRQVALQKKPQMLGHKVVTRPVLSQHLKAEQPVQGAQQVMQRFAGGRMQYLKSQSSAGAGDEEKKFDLERGKLRKPAL